jgi:POT family proton-dependent oligopeptide transporter
VTTERSIQPTSADGDSAFFGHPRGLSVLFFSELWERFSFYGMRALLVLYMVKALGYAEDGAYAIYGAYGALVYAFPVLGGWLANRWLGYRHAIQLGAVLMALGHFAMAIPDQTAFFAALALLCVGNGFFKPNISSTVGRLYQPGDSRRDQGFTIFYMGINIGALSAPLVCGKLGESVDWHYGFGVAGVGMLLGLVWFTRGQRHLGTHGDPPEPALLGKPVLLGLNRLHLVWLGSLVIVPLVAYLLRNADLASHIIHAVSALVLVALIGLALGQRGTARLRLFALLVLMAFHTLFWAGFEQAGSSFNVLTDRHVDRTILGIEFDASMFQSVNAIFIVLCAPLFTLLWRALDRAGREPSIPIKFALALLQLGLGFWVLTIGLGRADFGDDGSATMALGWMILCYLLHTTGELCISPVGLSAVTKLAPQRWVGFCMGAWFLTIANAHLVAAGIARLTGGGGDGDPLGGTAAIAQYAGVFNQVFYFAAIAGTLLLATAPLVHRLMKDVK